MNKVVPRTKEELDTLLAHRLEIRDGVLQLKDGSDLQTYLATFFKEPTDVVVVKRDDVLSTKAEFEELRAILLTVVSLQPRETMQLVLSDPQTKRIFFIKDISSLPPPEKPV